MDDDRIVALIAQYLEDRGFSDTLAALEADHGQVINRQLLTRGCELVARLTADYDAELAREMAALETNDAPKLDFADVDAAPQNAPLTKLKLKLPDHHHGNILCVKFAPDQPVVYTGGADKHVVAVDYDRCEVVARVGGFVSAVLEIDVCPAAPQILLVSEMAGVFTLLDLSDPSTPRVLHREQFGAKYLNRARFSPDGRLFAVACYDHTVGLYAFSNGRSGTSVPIKLRDWRYPGVPEAVAFSADSKTLIVAQRDDCCLQYIDTESYGVRAVNMNANGDAHVSFNVMDLDVHPGGKYLLTCTDKSRLILTHLDSGAHVRNFYGCVNDAYSMPRGAIDRNLGYVYASSQDRLVYVWDMHRQRIVDRLSHDGEIVRNLALHPTKPLLATVGFGKTLRIFTTADHDSTSLPTTSS